MKEELKKFFAILIVFAPALPVLADGIIPCSGAEDCNFTALLKLVDNVINWIIMIAVPVSAGVFAWAGIKYMMTGVSDQKADAKRMMGNVVKGLVFILAAWIIVGTILEVFIDPDFGLNISI